MPIHDWTRVKAGSFHHFHHAWTMSIANVLNQDVLPAGYYALAEQVVAGPIPDVITLSLPSPEKRPHPIEGGVAVVDSPPSTRFVSEEEEVDLYARKTDRIATQHEFGEVVTVIEIVSPGNKSSQHAIRSFVSKSRDFLENGISLLVLDLFPPSRRDPQGIHKAVWDEIRDEPFKLPADKPLTLVAYSAGLRKKAYIEPVAVDDVLPDMPAFLSPDRYVSVPLEASYLAAWNMCPLPIRQLLEA